MALYLLLAVVMGALLPGLQSTRLNHGIPGGVQISGHSNGAAADDDVVMSELLPRLQSTRLNRGIGGEVQISGHSDGAAADDKKLLECVVGKTQYKIIIQVSDQPFWEYYYTKEDHYKVTSFPGTTASFNCKTYTAPHLKAASALRNLTTPRMTEDMIGLIAKFNDSPELCRPCHEVTFKPKFLGKCSSPSIEGPLEEQRDRFQKVLDEVHEEGGSCVVFNSASAKPNTLQGCMNVSALFAETIRTPEYAAYYADARRFAACYPL